MGDLNSTFGLVRKVIYGTVTLFALIALILCAVVIQFTTSRYRGAYFTYTALGIATGFLTIFTLPLMIFLSLKRHGAFPTMIIVELVWTGILWVLWLSNGALIASGLWIGSCSVYVGALGAACMESQAIAAFSFLNWIFLLAYFIALLVLATRVNMRGHNGVFTSDVAEVDYNGASTHQVPSVMESKVDPAFTPQFTGSTVNPVHSNTGYGFPQQPATTPVNPVHPVQHVQTPSMPAYPQV
ncbi:hypothetical protein CPB83DRAFT_850055 [Crepidotus variabilis]|uniref:MARVEL domain-containing protein n=1 Tax=Crepidotus variabilis TaxID=179855 RepID=A0A9P6JSK2_9AGAR|nr:hypothetical protein CPB83DRAFT_850055 [Crepidotus variabilis]